MGKLSRGIILALLCAVFAVWQTGCAKNKDSAKAESNTATPSVPTVSASPEPELVKAGINVSRIDGINEDFIFGADISNIKSEYNCGTKYFDFDGNELFYAPKEGQKGFFTFLKECGLNWVQIHTKYGMNDLETVKEAGKLATDAGLHVLIEFCYPELQDMDIEEKTEAFKEYVVESLTELIDYGVDIGMAQINNEIITGDTKDTGEAYWENICALTNSGCDAVRYVADTLEKEILVALYFTGISKKQYSAIATALEDNQTDYDIFTALYYPNMDKNAEDFTSVMKMIAEKCDKKVMAVATADIYKLKGKKSVQRQADIVTNMIQSVINIGEAGTGIFLEPILFFNTKGRPLELANVFKYVFTGAVKK